MSATARDLEQLRQYGDSMGETLAAAGQQLALSVDADWNDAAWKVLMDLARAGLPFTSDDVAAVVGPAPSPGAAGALFRAGARSGLIACVGYSVSRRLSRHGGLVRKWQGTEGASGAR